MRFFAHWKVLALAASFALATTNAYADETTYRFDIPAQPVWEAVKDFVDASQAGGAGAMPDLDRSSIISAPVRGTFTRAQAIERMLAGTGCTLRSLGSTSADFFFLECPPPASIS